MPQFERMSSAIGPIIRDGAERGSHDATKAQRLALDLSRDLNQVGRELSLSLASGSGEYTTLVDGASRKAETLSSLLGTIGWKNPQAVQAAQAEITRLRRLLEPGVIEGLTEE